MSKVLFLDIDGVLNSYNNCMTWERLHHEQKDMPLNSHVLWDPHAITALRYIQDKIPDLKIVIHSTWRRHFDLEKFKMFFSESGLNAEQIHAFTNKGPKEQSIKDYLKENPVEAYVILDDRDMEDEKHQVYVHSLTGLTFLDVQKVFEILNVEVNLPVIMF